ncbi:hypothetical protein MTBLM5_550006 [Magnetospirillum sp. LM-5]|nr:hypothetical protein MTBLM5_550006 [Magnetospirillum sp. LM-5]
MNNGRIYAGGDLYRQNQVISGALIMEQPEALNLRAITLAKTMAPSNSWTKQHEVLTAKVRT